MHARRRVVTMPLIRPLSGGRIVFIVICALLVIAILDTAVRLFLKSVYADLMRVNTAPIDWAVPVFLGILFALVFFPYRNVRRLPRKTALLLAAVALGSAAVVVRLTQPPIGREHITILLSLGAFVTSGTLKRSPSPARYESLRATKLRTRSSMSRSEEAAQRDRGECVAYNSCSLMS